MTTETFDSDTQRGCFNVDPTYALEDRADTFLGGLSRAFTLACPFKHTVDKNVERRLQLMRGRSTGARSRALFTNAQGETFLVTVQQFEATRCAA